MAKKLTNFSVIKVFFIAWTFVLGGCSVTKAPYHAVCPQSTECPSSELDAAILGPEHPTYISNFGFDANHREESKKYPNAYRQVFFRKTYLEYDEDGHLSGGHQLQAISRYLTNPNFQKPIFVVAYVHGWHHNANTDPGETDENSNAIKFDFLLARVEDNLRRSGFSHEVLGIYIGWRGEATTAPIATILTIGNRAAVADRIGSNLGEDGIRNVLGSFADKVRASNPESRMLVMGHSLGGRMLSRAFMADLNMGDAQPLKARTIINLVNPAIDADAYRLAYRATPNDPTHAPGAELNPQVPAWVNLTSKDDWTTKATYFLARAVGLIKGEPSPQHLKAIGHLNSRITHVIEVVHCGEKPEDHCKNAAEMATLSKNNIWSTGERMRSSVIYTDSINKRGADSYCVQVARNPISKNEEEAIANDGSCSGLAAAFTGEDDLNVLSHRAVPGRGRMWNVLGSKALIDSTSKNAAVPVHNAYVETTWTKLLIDLAFAPENSR